MEMITLDRCVELLSAGMELFAAVICALLLLGGLIGYREKKMSRRYMLILLGAHIIMLLCDAMIWLWIDKVAYILIVQILYVITYALGCVIFALFTYCLTSYISEKTHVPHWINQFVRGYCVAILLLWIAGMFSGLLVYFDENGLIHYGDYYWVSQMFGVVLLIGDMLLVLKYRKEIGTADTIVLLLYAVFPLIGCILQIWCDVLSFYLGTTFSVLLYYIVIYAEHERALMFQKNELMRKEIELSDSRTRILINQIQPHFLINSLVTIRHLCKRDTAEAVETIDHFSGYLRESMEALTLRQGIPFERELETVKNYLYLEQKRFGDKLQVRYKIEEMSFMVPALSVQPIVENAVCHGIRKKLKGGCLTIATYKEDKDYVIKIEDNGVGFLIDEIMKDGKNHVGIANVTSRIEMMCSGQLVISSIPTQGTTVLIRIPIRYSLEESREEEHS
ncbi:MAG: histidine kinase [Clostridia bacterium]|nr:histidine kinase [Clostridia bacterium]